VLHYDGRLTTPSACPHIVRLSWLSRVYRAIMRRSFEIPANRVNRSWFDRNCQLVNWLREVAFAKTLARSAVSGKTGFCFLLSDEKLLRRLWVLTRIVPCFLPPRRYDFVDSLSAWFLSGQTCARMGGLCSHSGRGVPDNLLLLRLPSTLPNGFRQCD